MTKEDFLNELLNGVHIEQGEKIKWEITPNDISGLVEDAEVEFHIYNFTEADEDLKQFIVEKLSECGANIDLSNVPVGEKLSMTASLLIDKKK